MRRGSAAPASAATAWSTSSAMISADRLLGGHHADRLAGHHRAGLDIAVDHRAAQRAGPEMLDLELRGLLVSSPAWNRSRVSAWMRRKRLVPSLTSPRTGITGKRSSSCTDGTASRASARMKACLKLRMRDRFGGGGEAACRAARRTRPSPDRTGSPRRGRGRRRRRPAPRECAAGSPAPARSARPGRYGRRPPMPSITSASAPDADQPLGQHQGRGEADQLGAAVLDARVPRRRAECRRPARRGRPSPPRRPGSASSSCGMHGDQVDAERLVGQRLRGRRSRPPAASGVIEPQAITPKPPALEIAATRWRSTDPAHGAAHDGELAAEERRAARPQPVEPAARALRQRSDRHGDDQAASRP